VRRPLLAFTALALLLVAGCRAKFVQANLINSSGNALQQVQIDYPTASFGLNQFPDGGNYQYDFSIRGSKELHISFTDSAGKSHDSTGPVIYEGQQGSIEIRITPGYSVVWILHLNPMRNAS
jgi:hypothetical protein